MSADFWLTHVEGDVWHLRPRSEAARGALGGRAAVVPSALLPTLLDSLAASTPEDVASLFRQRVANANREAEFAIARARRRR
jgi:hypothetical protein